MPLEQALKDFERLRTAISVSDLERLARRMSTHVDAVAEAALVQPELPVDLAMRLASALAELVDAAATMDREQRAIVHAAVRYFILTGDADNDLTSPHGLADDVHVFNEASRLLEREDLQITY